MRFTKDTQGMLEMFEKRTPMLPLNLQFFADGGEGGEGGAGDGGEGGEGGEPGEGADDGGGEGGEGGDDDNTLSMTQEELDAAIEKRLKRERKNHEKEIEKIKRDQKLTDEERKEEQRKEAEREAQTKIEAANQRLINSEARAIALEEGVDPKRLKYALKMADLDDVEVDDDGEVDAKAISASFKTLLKDMPELKKERTSAGGGDFGGGNGDGLTEDQIANMSPDEINKRWSEVSKFLEKN